MLSKKIKLTRCPLPGCGGILNHSLEQIECIRCGFIITKDCCQDEEEAAK